VGAAVAAGGGSVPASHANSMALFHTLYSVALYRESQATEHAAAPFHALSELTTKPATKTVAKCAKEGFAGGIWCDQKSLRCFP
jgi:hypothetical protein